MTKKKPLFDRYCESLRRAVKREREAHPDFHPAKFTWGGWDCWKNGYEAGKRDSQRR